MPFTPQQIQQAEAIQIAAAEDANSTVRLVAGPGTGKSKVIEKRALWLTTIQKVAPQNIIAVSFTRAASKDLKSRIYRHCAHVNSIDQLRVSTLHSLALRVLRQTGNLNIYPANPTILDEWELDEIFDAEFSVEINCTATRSEKIRQEHEAFWSTQNWNPPNLTPAVPPITAPERASYTGYYQARSQLYCCVLPGQIIRACVDLIRSGHINPVAELGVEHLIVDEVQDLNPCDFEFIDLLIAGGVNVFISGDDDQSIYSFRYAFPLGIQAFTLNYPGSTSHVLNDCFRCTTSVLQAALNVINTHPPQNRIAKNLSSLYTASNPPNNGFTRGYIFTNPTLEARYIAQSCQALIAAGIPADDIMILMANKRKQLSSITGELNNSQLPFDASQKDDFKDSEQGRFVLGLLRILADDQDYIALRTILSTPRGIGLRRVKSIGDKVIAGGLNFRNLFHIPLPNGVFSMLEEAAINKVKNNLQAISTYALNDTLNQRTADIENLILSNFSANEVKSWRDIIATLPVETRLEELKDYLQTDSVENKDNILKEVFLRLNQQAPQAPNHNLARIKVMTFHSSKGLDSKIVFIPGLEEMVFPTERTRHSPGLLLENARLLYVAITRAKAACIISYCRARNMNGQNTPMAPSRFAVATLINFVQQNNAAFSPVEINALQAAIATL